jgi:uncharacterized membrane protein
MDMNRLLLGVLLFSSTHLAMVAAPALRQKITASIGTAPWKGLFSLLQLLALYLMISGWGSASALAVYTPIDWSRFPTAVLVLAGIVLFFAPYPPNNFRRMLRHPQLVGVLCWGTGHLLSNGDSRSLLLFGGLAAWSVLQIYFLNQRDPSWNRPKRALYLYDILLVLFGIIVYLLLANFHSQMFGVTPFPNIP